MKNTLPPTQPMRHQPSEAVASLAPNADVIVEHPGGEDEEERKRMHRHLTHCLKAQGTKDKYAAAPIKWRRDFSRNSQLFVYTKLRKHVFEWPSPSPKKRREKACAVR